MDTSRALPHQQGNQRTQYASAHPLSAHHERDEEMDLLSPLSGQKRRRFNEDNQRSYAINSPTSYSGSPQYRGQPPISAGGYRSQHMSGTGTLNRPGSIGLPPQHPSPVNQQARHQYPTRSNTFDESLRLPPLQTKVLTSATPSRRQDIRTEARELQARSIEAMVMTIPYINKIKVLRKISPPLQPPGPTSPAQETRGAVIAIEGPDKTLLADVGAFVCEYLLKDSSFSVQTWCSTSSSKRLSVSPSRDIEILDVTNSTPTSGEAQIFTKPEEKDPIVDYLSLISDWHNKSQDIIKYITSSPDVPTSNTNSAVSTSANIVPAPQDSKILPVALVLNGFSLTSSDQFALRTPINDSYAPVDHWQWMATLWRGIVGPDLTVYVTRVGREEMSKYGGVEIREDCAAIIVRIPEIGKMEEKASRRLGFEVVEFVRNVESAFGRA
jgi:HMG box factor